jgi:4'-phosphopantetheinyl transferase
VSARSVEVRDPAEKRVRMEGNDVHLWWREWDADAPMEASTDALRGWLSDDERRRSERFRRERDARAFVFRRGFLRSVLAGEIGCAPAELRFRTGEFGKPCLDFPPTPLHFSASSSSAWILVALSARREIGVDVEHVANLPRGTEELSRLAWQVLTRAERGEFERLAPDARPIAFLRAWTRKEALLKAVGLGLSCEPNTVDTGLALLTEPRTLRGTLFRGGSARLFDLAAPQGFAASLVVDALPAERLRIDARAA